jgi:hypothetical protein
MAVKRSVGYLDIFRPHPLLGWSMSPNEERDVSFREGVFESIGADGWRRVVGAPAAASSRIAFYGCSFTYGTALRDEETFVSLLQSMLPSAMMLNRGVGGYGTTQNYLQFRNDLKEHKVDAAVFCVISDHRYRNYGHPVWMRRHLLMQWYEIGVEQMPRARIDRSGKVWIEFIPIWQPSLLREDFDFIFPDEFTLDRLTIAVLQEIQEVASAHDVPILIAVLDSVDDPFFAILHKAIPSALDVSTPYDSEHTFLPHDIHPNVGANEIFAERLFPHVSSLISDLGSR